jgi:hypothetical protein
LFRRQLLFIAVNIFHRFLALFKYVSTLEFILFIY